MSIWQLPSSQVSDIETTLYCGYYCLRRWDSNPRYREDFVQVRLHLSYSLYHCSIIYERQFLIRLETFSMSLQIQGNNFIWDLLPSRKKNFYGWSMLTLHSRTPFLKVQGAEKRTMFILKSAWKGTSVLSVWVTTARNTRQGNDCLLSLSE